jgi:formate dehydrogenase major subunit
VIGANPTVNHPVAADLHQERGAARRQADRDRSAPHATSARHATLRAAVPTPDSDVALLNAMMHVIVDEGLVRRAFRRRAHQRLRAHWRRTCAAFTPEAHGAGLRHSRPRPSARWRACTPRSRASMILWGMGVAQHVHGTDNARCLIALALMTGQIGQPGTGLHPLRGQNNVQGASDAGPDPDDVPRLPARRRRRARARWSSGLWGAPTRPAARASTVVEVDEGRAMPAQVARHVHHGREPGRCRDPDARPRARRRWRSLEHAGRAGHLPDRDRDALADVVLPASALPEKTGTVTNTDRMVQLGRAAHQPPGEARRGPLDHPAAWPARAWASTCGLSRRGRRSSTRCAEAMHPASRGITWERLERELVAYPCPDEDDPGHRWCSASASTADGRARLVPAQPGLADEQPDAASAHADHRPPPRTLAHRRHDPARRGALRVDPLPRPRCTRPTSPDFGVAPGRGFHLSSRRGSIALTARADEGIARHGLPALRLHRGRGQPAHQPGARSARQDPFKYCAVRVEPAGDPVPVGAFTPSARKSLTMSTLSDFRRGPRTRRQARQALPPCRQGDLGGEHRQRVAASPAQYAGLQALHERYRDQGLVVLGLSCNQFGAQEPGDADEIGAFCERKLRRRLPALRQGRRRWRAGPSLLAIVTAQAPGLLGSQAVKWNFTKFLVARDGSTVSRHAPQVEPAALAAEIETLLAQPGAR